MARPRNFDLKDVIQKAMMAFWQDGYEGTTMRSLQEATGVNGKGLSNVFGDKEQIFLKALEAYSEMYENVLNDSFAIPSLVAIEKFFEGLIEDQGTAEDPLSNGCLMVNTVFEIDRASGDVKKIVDQYRHMFVVHFSKSLEAANIEGVDDKAEFLVGMLWGALLQMKLCSSRAAAVPMTQQVLKTISSWG